MFTMAPSICAYVSGTQNYPFDPSVLDIRDETLVGFTALTSTCEACANSFAHVQVDGWQVFTTEGIYWLDNDGIVYRSRMMHPFK